MVRGRRPWGKAGDDPGKSGQDENDRTECRKTNMCRGVRFVRKKWR